MLADAPSAPAAWRTSDAIKATPKLRFGAHNTGTLCAAVLSALISSSVKPVVPLSSATPLRAHQSAAVRVPPGKVKSISRSADALKSSSEATQSVAGRSSGCVLDTTPVSSYFSNSGICASTLRAIRPAPCTRARVMKSSGQRTPARHSTRSWILDCVQFCWIHRNPGILLTVFSDLWRA